MISVVKNGKEKTYFTRCIKCASELEYEFSDVEFIPPTDNFCFETKNIVCPVCGEKNCVGLLTKDEFEKQFSIPTYSFSSGRCR